MRRNSGDHTYRLATQEAHGNKILDFTGNRHVDLKLFYMQSLSKRGLVSNMKVPGAEHVADLWTEFL